MSWRMYVLMAHDPATGWASAVVGVLGLMPPESVDDDLDRYVSWIPLRDATGGWPERIAAVPDSVLMAEAVEEWLALADGISWDLVELEAPTSPDLRGSVETTIDELFSVLAVPSPVMN